MEKTNYKAKELLENTLIRAAQYAPDALVTYNGTRAPITMAGAMNTEDWSAMGFTDFDEAAEKRTAKVRKMAAAACAVLSLGGIMLPTLSYAADAPSDNGQDGNAKNLAYVLDNFNELTINTPTQATLVNSLKGLPYGTDFEVKFAYGNTPSARDIVLTRTGDTSAAAIEKYAKGILGGAAVQSLDGDLSNFELLKLIVGIERDQTTDGKEIVKIVTTTSYNYEDTSDLSKKTRSSGVNSVIVLESKDGAYVPVSIKIKGQERYDGEKEAVYENVVDFLKAISPYAMPANHLKSADETKTEEPVSAPPEAPKRTESTTPGLEVIVTDNNMNVLGIHIEGSDGRFETALAPEKPYHAVAKCTNLDCTKASIMVFPTKIVVNKTSEDSYKMAGTPAATAASLDQAINFNKTGSYMIVARVGEEKATAIVEFPDFAKGGNNEWITYVAGAGAAYLLWDALDKDKSAPAKAAPPQDGDDDEKPSQITGDEEGGPVTETWETE